MICPIMSYQTVDGIFVDCKGTKCMMFRKYMNWQCQEMKLPLGSGYCGMVIE